jgi:hypothetical protein
VQEMPELRDGLLAVGDDGLPRQQLLQHRRPPTEEDLGRRNPAGPTPVVRAAGAGFRGSPTPRATGLRHAPRPDRAAVDAPSDSRAAQRQLTGPYSCGGQSTPSRWSSSTTGRATSATGTSTTWIATSP